MGKDCEIVEIVKVKDPSIKQENQDFILMEKVVQVLYFEEVSENENHFIVNDQIDS